MTEEFLKRLGTLTGKTYTKEEFGKIVTDCVGGKVLEGVKKEVEAAKKELEAAKAEVADLVAELKSHSAPVPESPEGKPGKETDKDSKKNK